MMGYYDPVCKESLHDVKWEVCASPGHLREDSGHETLYLLTKKKVEGQWQLLQTNESAEPLNLDSSVSLKIKERFNINSY
jgi:hypothetical protein